MDIVNTQTTGNQRVATVTALDGGGYVIAWRGVAYGGEAIWFQRYGADGAKLGAETWAKDVDPAGKEVPQLTGLEGGRFLVNGKLYDAAGIPMGGTSNATLATRYSFTPEGQHLSESDPTIAGLPGGGYVTVETKTAYLGTYPGETFVVRWFNEAGQQQRQYERPLEQGDGATTATSSTLWPGVIALADGKVLVTWHEGERRSASAEFDLFSPDGQLLKHGDIAIRGSIAQLDVTPLPDGGFVAAWAGANYMGSYEGYYQRYDASGAPVGELVNLGPVSAAPDPIRVSSTTTLENGDIVLVFEVWGSAGFDIAVEHLDALGGNEPPPDGGDGVVVTSPGPGSSLTGGSGDDILNASQGSDTLTGGAGRDAFVWANEPWSPASVTDFAVGSDRLDISRLFQSAGYSGSDPVADGRVVLMGQGADTLVLFDNDGSGGDWPNYIIKLQGVSSAGLTWSQLSGGAAPPPPPASTLQFRTTTLTVTETDDRYIGFDFVVERGGDTSGSATAKWTVGGSGQTAAQPADFPGGAFPSGSVTFAPGETVRTVTVYASFDNTAEPDEAFRVTLFDPTGASLGPAAFATGIIDDDDSGAPAPSTLNFSTTSQVIAEGSNGGSTAWSYTVVRSGDAGGTATVNWAVTGSGAAPADGADFAGGVLDGGTLTFAPGETSKAILVRVVGDTVHEPDEGFTIRLGNAQGATLGAASEATGTITNDDPHPSNGQVINSPGPGARLTGGPGADTLNASRGADTLTGAGGADRFVFADENWAPATITDFQSGQDRIDLRGVLDDWGYTGSDPIADGRVILLADSAGTKVLLDDDGPGGAWGNYVLLIQGVQPGGLQSGDWMFQ